MIKSFVNVSRSTVLYNSNTLGTVYTTVPTHQLEGREVGQLLPLGCCQVELRVVAVEQGVGQVVALTHSHDTLDKFAASGTMT